MRKRILVFFLVPWLVCGVSLGTFFKTPSEAYNFAFSFAGVAGNDGITLVSVTAVNALTGADLSSTIIAASPPPQVTSSVTVNGVATPGLYVVFRAQGGSNNQRVLVNCVVTDNVTGEILNPQITLLISSGLGH